MSVSAEPHQDGAQFSADEQELLAGVDQALRDATSLLSWWDTTNAGEGTAQRFDLARTANRPESNFGFFADVPVAGRLLPTMGVNQEMFYDQPKARPLRRESATEWTREQMREFSLRYFMRVSDFSQPEPAVDPEDPAPPYYLRPLSWCPEAGDDRAGFGFCQLYYKLRDGTIGRFAEDERYAIVDLRELGKTYEWIVVRVRVFAFDLTFHPLGPDGPALQLPLKEESYLVVSPEFIADEDQPEPGVAGNYGVGYAFLRSPGTAGLLAYGPGQLQPAFQTIHFAVHDDGRIRAKLKFAVNRPRKILNISLDPLSWGYRLADLFSLGTVSRAFGPAQKTLGSLPTMPGSVDPVFAFITLANLFSGGLANRQLCISKAQLEKDFLVQHHLQHYTTVVGSLLTWRQIADWLDTAALPAWALDGKSA